MRNQSLPLITAARRLFALLALLALVGPGGRTQAQNHAIGEIVMPEDLSSGMQVVFQGAAHPTSYLTARFNPPNGWNKFEGCTQSFEGALNPPDSIVFYIEKDETQNKVTGSDQWYIRNKATGLYLTFEWDQEGQPSQRVYEWSYGKGHPFWTADKASAKSFCFTNNSDADWAATYGGTNAGRANYPYAYTIAHIYGNADGYFKKNGNEGCENGATWLSMGGANSGYSLAWYGLISERTSWNICQVIDADADKVAALKALLAGYSATIDDDYKPGTDPGYINNAEAVEEFYNAYTEATQKADEYTNDQAAAMIDRLNAAKAAVDAAKVQIKDGGYYYIKTAYSTATENGDYGMFAMYRPKGGLMGMACKKADDNDDAFIWQVTALPADSGYFAFRNVASGKYIGTYYDANDGTCVTISDEPAAISATDLGAGQWTLSAKSTPGKIYSLDGYDKSRNIFPVRSSSGGQNSIVAWSLREVPADRVSAVSDDAHKAKDELLQSYMDYESYSQGLSLGAGPGKVKKQQTLDAFTEALRVAAAFVYGDSTGTAAEMTAAREALVSIGAQIAAEVKAIPNGYYRIRSAYGNFINNRNDAYFAIYDDNTPGWKHYQKTSEQLWKLESVTGGFSLQNAKNGKYIGTASSAAANSALKFVSTPVAQLISNITTDGQMKLTNSLDSAFGYFPAGNNQGAGESGQIALTSEAGAYTPAAWILEPVSDADAQAIISNEADNELNIKLQEAFEEGRTLYNSGTNYTIGNALITDRSQLYANNWSTHDGQQIQTLIDGDKTTWNSWGSTWEANTEQDPQNPHYLRFYDEAGFPDSVQVNYYMRQCTQHPEWVSVPVKLRVEVSNDGDSNWITLYELKEPDITNGGSIRFNRVITDSLQYIITGIKGYKYVRLTSEVNRGMSTGSVFTHVSYNYHMRFQYAEINFYPITGVASTSYTQGQMTKDFASELYSALQEAYPQYIGGNATQAVYDRLSAALQAYKNIGYNDSVFRAAKKNVEDYYNRVGDELDKYPADAYDTYANTVERLTNAIYDKQESGEPISGSEIIETVKELTDAFNTFLATRHWIKENTWYYFFNADQEREGYEADGDGGTTTDEWQRFCNGNAMMAPRSNNSKDAVFNIPADALHWDGYDHAEGVLADSVASDPYSMWRLVKYTGNEDYYGGGKDVYAIQNRATGMYVAPSSNHNGPVGMSATPHPYQVTSLGEGQLNFTSTDSTNTDHRPLQCQGVNRVIVTWEGLIDSPAAWTVEEVPSDIKSLEYPITANSARILTLPFAYDGSTAALNSENNVETYAVKGLSADGSKLELYKKSSFEAGEPMVVVSGDKAERIYLPLADSYSYEVKSANGLVGVFSYTLAPTDAGLLSLDSVRQAGSGAAVNGLGGYVDMSSITNDDTQTLALSIPVSDIINGIRDVSAGGNNTTADVYSIDGVLVKRAAKGAAQTEGLKKGVYIIGGKKVLVK
jgi:hypothetical protein